MSAVAAAVGWAGVAGAAPALAVVAVQPAGGQVTLVAAVSPAPASPLESSAFRVTGPGGGPVAATAEPVVSGELTAGLVLDTSEAGAADLQDGVNGAASFLLQLPDGARTMVVADGGPPTVLAPLGPGASTAVAAVNSIRPSGERQTGAALKVALDGLPAAPGRPRLLLLHTGSADAGGEAATDLARRLRTAGVLLAVVDTGADQRYWSQVAQDTGGVLVSARGSAALAAFDRVAGLLRERYAVTFPRPAELPATVRVSVQAAAGTATASVDLPAEAAAVPPAAAPPAPGGRGVRWWVPVAVVLGVAGGAALALLRLRTASPTPSAPARAARAAPPPAAYRPAGAAQRPGSPATAAAPAGPGRPEIPASPERTALPAEPPERAAAGEPAGPAADAGRPAEPAANPDEPAERAGIAAEPTGRAAADEPAERAAAEQRTAADGQVEGAAAGGAERAAEEPAERAAAEQRAAADEQVEGAAAGRAERAAAEEPAEAAAGAGGPAAAAEAAGPEEGAVAEPAAAAEEAPVAEPAAEGGGAPERPGPVPAAGPTPRPGREPDPAALRHRPAAGSRRRPGAAGGSGRAASVTPGITAAEDARAYRQLDAEAGRTAAEVVRGRLDTAHAVARLAFAARGRLDLLDRVIETERLMSGAHVGASPSSASVISLLTAARRIVAGEVALAGPAGVRVELCTRTGPDGRPRSVLRLTGRDRTVRECRTPSELARHVDLTTLTPDQS